MVTLVSLPFAPPDLTKGPTPQTAIARHLGWKDRSALGNLNPGLFFRSLRPTQRADSHALVGLLTSELDLPGLLVATIPNWIRPFGTRYWPRQWPRRLGKSHGARLQRRGPFRILTGFPVLRTSKLPTRTPAPNVRN